MGERKDLPAGARLGDGKRYEIRRKVGQGAMAEVYQAVDRRLNNRIVAVKTLSASLADHKFTKKMLALFIEEAQALSRVKDDNVVAVLDSGTSADGTPYMVMEFLHGRDLSGLLKEEKRLSVERTADIILAVCAGVHACHLAGIIHRDLKPANIFLEHTTKGEQPKVLDFSVAKVPVSRDQTRTDLIVGTPNYMSPEQALGRPADELSDQYSIGALVYRCLVGKPPQGLLARPREIRPEISEEFEAVLLRAMDPIPANRYPTVHHLGHHLLAFASPTGRLRWNSYYDTAPFAVPVIMDRSSGASASIDAGLDATTKGRPYDFGIHERTTQSESPPPADESDLLEQPPTSADDGPPTLNARPTLDAVEMSSDNGRPFSQVVPGRWGRRRVFTASIIGSIALLVGAFATARLVGTRHVQPFVPAPPAWTQAEEPAPAKVSPAASKAPTVVRAVPLDSIPAPVSERSAASLPLAADGKDPAKGLESATTPSNRSKTGSRRRPNPSQRDRAALQNDSLRWLGGTVVPPGAVGQGFKPKYPAVGSASESKYPAVQ